MSKVLTKLLNATDSRISSYSNESASGDGHWLYLKPGWISSQGTHCIHEWTVAEALTELKYIERCTCEDCPKVSGIDKVLDEL